MTNENNENSAVEHYIFLFGPLRPFKKQLKIEYCVSGEYRSHIATRTQFDSSDIEKVQAFYVDRHYVLKLHKSNHIFGVEHSYEKADERTYQKAKDIAMQAAKEKGVALEALVKRPNLKSKEKMSKGTQ